MVVFIQILIVVMMTLALKIIVQLMLDALLPSPIVIIAMFVRTMIVILSKAANIPKLIVTTMIFVPMIVATQLWDVHTPHTFVMITMNALTTLAIPPRESVITLPLFVMTTTSARMILAMKQLAVARTLK